MHPSTPSTGVLLCAFEQHYAELVRYIARRTGSMEEARGLAHDTWLRIAERQADNDTSLADPRAYLFTLLGGVGDPGGIINLVRKKPLGTYDFTQGGYTVLNAMVQYRIDPRWTLSLNVNNLSDKVYYQTVGYARGGNFYGTPRGWLLTLRRTF